MLYTFQEVNPLPKAMWCSVHNLANRAVVCLANCNSSLKHTSSLSAGQWLCEVERFDPAANQWTLIAPMHHSRTGVAVTALKGEGTSMSRSQIFSSSVTQFYC